MILHDITWYYMQKLYSYNLTIKTSIYSKLAGHDQNKTSPVPCSNHRTASWRPSLVRWMASPRLPIMANGYQKKTPEKYHPTSSNIIQHLNKLQQFSISVCVWPSGFCFTASFSMSSPVCKSMATILPGPSLPLDLNMSSARRKSRRFCGFVWGTVVNQNPRPWPLLLKDEYKKPCLIAWNQGMNRWMANSGEVGLGCLPHLTRLKMWDDVPP